MSRSIQARSAVEFAQGLADDVLAGAFLFGELGDQVCDGLLNLRALESELLEGEERILHFARLRDVLRKIREREFREELHDLVAELDDHAFGGTRTDAADVLEHLDVRVDDGVAERGDVHAAEDGKGCFRTDAVHSKQEFEDLKFLLLREAEELERILADLEPGQERGSAAFLRQDVVGAHGDGNEIADAVHVEDEFGEVQGNDLACESSDHVWASLLVRSGRI